MAETIKTPWVFFNMSQNEWKDLPWHKKKKMLLELEGKPGVGLSPVTDTFENLFQAWCRHNAETETILYNNPHLTKGDLK